MKIAIVGAGITGCVIARQLAEAGIATVVFESRSHVGGNCYTEVDEKTGVIVHRYGPHIFHTDKRHVWDYLNRFGRFRPYIHRVKAVVKGEVYSLPINLHTLNQFFRTAMRPNEARARIAAEVEAIETPRNFEQQALALVGRRLYEAFFEGYTRKQWGLPPECLPASILKRLPVRFNYNDAYFDHPWQAIPEEGYTPVFERMLDHPLIELRLGTFFNRDQANEWDHIFYSGPLDAWFDHRWGHLPYRTLDFERRICEEDDYQGAPVINYPDADVPWTRITEHRHFAPWRPVQGTVVYFEYSRACEAGDIPYYPVRLAEGQALLEKYQAAAADEARVTFVGRLGRFAYLDMDVAVDEALEVAHRFIERVKG